MAREVIYLHDVEPRPRYMYSWERFKHREVHWLVEMFAEMIGVFLYVYAGLGPTAALIIGNLTAQTGIGSLYTIGFAYAIGIILAITLCAATSGGHFSPAVTITLSLFRGFPKARAVRYIIAQILGSFLTCLVVYVQWKDLLVAGEEVLKEKGLYDTLMFTNTGPAGVFALYVAPGTNLHRVLLNEFVTDFMLGLAICGVMDTTNHFIPPVVAPWIIGLTYATAIWGYAPTAIALNTARDVGGRMMALAIWGKQASGGPYAAIAALTNIPATILAFAVYDLFLGSANRTLSPYHIDFLRAQLQYQQDNGLPPQVHPEALKPREKSSSFGGAERPVGDMETPEGPLRAENHA